jgi:hypothetical protein
MDVSEWFKRSDVFVVEMSALAVEAMNDDPERETPKSYGDAIESAIAYAERNEEDCYVVLKVKYERSE